MKQDKYSKTYLLIYALGLIPVIWVAILIAPYMDGGIPGLIIIVVVSVFVFAVYNKTISILNIYLLLFL